MRWEMTPEPVYELLCEIRYIQYVVRVPNPGPVGVISERHDSGIFQTLKLGKPSGPAGLGLRIGPCSLCGPAQSVDENDIDESGC
jgi:hypothetical protein